MHKEKLPASARNISRTAILMAVDAVLANLSMILALQILYDPRIPMAQIERFGRIWPVLTVFALACFFVTGLYRTLWEYAGAEDVLQVVAGSTATVCGVYAFSLIANMIQPSPNLFLMRRTVYLLCWVILTVFMICSRFSFRYLRRMRNRAERGGVKRVMIVGAGWAGSTLARDLAAAGHVNGRPVVMIDDNPVKIGTRIGRVPVCGGIASIPDCVQRYDVEEIVIAIPSASPARIQEIFELCASTKCRIKLMPGVRDVSGGQLQTGPVRDVHINDLLSRDEVELDMASISGYLQGKNVLVTGGGGSIGSELCRQIARFSPKRLVIFDIYENNAYELCNELKQKYGERLDVEVLIGSVRDVKRLEQVFTAEKPQVVFHAAAHKHVPLMEVCPAEAVKNNVFGTLNVARCADKFGVDRFVLLSTDKAVNPANVMGATKRVTEMIMQYMCKQSKTHFMAVRFGNVLGSNGSVIPLFRRQIENGGPVTVTHPDITRYFMTIPEAAQLVLQAGAINESGAVFVLDMGTPVKIVDLARNLIRLSGYEPDVEIRIEYSGLRPGEKLYEELMMADEKEQLKKTGFGKIMVSHPTGFEAKVFERMLGDLRDAAETDPALVEDALKPIVPGFHHMKLEKPAS